MKTIRPGRRRLKRLMTGVASVTAVLLTALIAGAPAARAAPNPGLILSKVATLGGAPLASIVVSGADVAFASNPTLNEIEVLDLKSGALGTPIAVGPQPQGLDLSPDGTTLYVADSGAAQVSVVDVASGKESHRITIPPRSVLNDTPYSIAVANNGKALLSTSSGGGGDGVLLEINLSSEAVRLRSDFYHAGSTFDKTKLMPSGDHSHIGVVVGSISSAPMWMYNASTDSFGPERDVNDRVENLALDSSGSRMLVDPGAYLFDGAAVLGRIRGGGLGMVMAPSGTTAYRVQDSAVEVLDLSRLRVVATIALPENVGSGPGGVAISPDGTTLAVLTASGISVIAVANAQSVATCTNTVTKTSPGFGVLPVCGAPLAAIVMDGTGHAFASNPSRNEVDVVNVYTGALETTIPVGSEPHGLDFSPDGTTLYVADSGGSQVSVIDVTTRRETRRVNIPPPVLSNSDSAYSIAVADNGKAFLSTTFNGTGGGGRMLEINLNTGAVRLRSDFYVRGMASEDTRLVPSGDHSHIGVVDASSSDGPVWVYDASTDSFGPERDLAWYVADVAMDRTGSRLVVGNSAFLTGGAYLLDGAAVPGWIPGAGRGIVMAASANIAYRVHDGGVEVLDLARLRVAATIALPEILDPGPGLVALSPDGTTLAVLTATGISLVAVASAQPVATCTNAVTPTSPNFGVLPLCGAPLASVVIDGTGHAFASNPSRNEVDVVNVRSGAWETAIPVGSEPTGLDLSSDGATLYVADRGGNQVSVVDVATRLETRRINIPPHPFSGFDTPFSIAVANNGKALLSTSFNGSGFGARLLEIDLSTGAVRPRTDFNNGGPTTESTVLASSGDHSHIGIAVGDIATGPVFMYTAATDSFTPEHDFGFVNMIALDHSGNRVVLGGVLGTFVLDGNLARVGTFATQGIAASVAADGTAYRLQPDRVEVVDLEHKVVRRTIPLPDTASGLPWAIAVSPDGTSLAVLTARGMSLISTVAPVPATFSYPLDQQTSVETDKPFTWNTVAGAQGYILVVGTTRHGHDLANSGVLPPSRSAFNVPDLPAGRTLYATLLTEVNGAWTVFHDITFTAAVGHATLTYPLDLQTNIDTTKPFTWNQIGAAQGYILVVGTTPHGHDLVNSGVLNVGQSAFNVPDLPAGRTLYATLLTEVNGAWTRFQDVRFTAAAGHATFTNPVNGQNTTNNAKPFTWATSRGAQGYILVVGTSAYGTDLVNSGTLPASQSSYTVPSLPKGKVLHATLLTKVNGAFTRFQAIVFTISAS